MSLWPNILGTTAPVILDIGANDGETTNEFLAEFPAARVYAFEPDPRAIAKFKRNVTSSRATLYETAIGATDGTAEFWVSSGTPPGDIDAKLYPEGWDQSGSLRAPKNHAKFWPWVKFESKISVPVTRLDTWTIMDFPEVGTPIDLIWADVQGAEGDLIKGGKLTLQCTRFLFIEYSDSEWYRGQPKLAELRRQLTAIGEFRILGFYGPNVLFGRL